MKKKVAYIAPDVLVRAIINKKDKVVWKIINQKKIKIVTSSFCFYELFSCLTEQEIIDNVKAIKQLLKKIAITDLKEFTGKFEIEKISRIKHLRKVAMVKDKVKLE